MKHITPLLFLIALIAAFLVPYGWVAQQSPLLDRLFNQVFQSLAAHVVGHALIFATIGLMALRVVPWLRGHAAIYAALILCVALGQEGFQVLYKGHLYLGDTLNDIGIDLVAAAFARQSRDTSEGVGELRSPTKCTDCAAARLRRAAAQSVQHVPVRHNKAEIRTKGARQR